MQFAQAQPQEGFYSEHKSDFPLIQLFSAAMVSGEFSQIMTTRAQ